MKTVNKYVVVSVMNCVVLTDCLCALC